MPVSAVGVAEAAEAAVGAVVRARGDVADLVAETVATE